MSDPERRPALLLVHHDADLLDRLTRLFEARGFAVTVAATSMQARARLESDREFAVIIAGWEPGQGLGADVYKWALRNRFHLRGQFVFLADEVPDDFDAVVAGRCLVLRPGDSDEIVRVAEAAAARAARLAELDADDVAWVDESQPSLLLADDDPVLLLVMSRFFGDAGFAVTQVETVSAAIAQLDRNEFDVIVLDWHMVDGTGGEVYQWLGTFRPWLVDRTVFLTGGTVDAIRRHAGTRPVIPKGQDSQTLLELISRLARGHRAH